MLARNTPPTQVPPITQTQPPAHLWGITADLAPLPGGFRNLAFRTIGLARDLVFKSTRRSPAAINWLLPVQDLARVSGFAVPHFIPSLHGTLTEHGWTCETFIPGRKFLAQEMPPIAPQITRFHQLSANIPQRPGFASSQSLLTRPQGGDVDLATMPAELAETCRTAWRSTSDHACTIVHGDLNPANLLRCPDGQIALIDWDECRRDLVLFDLGQLLPASPSDRRAILAREVACSWQIEPAHARELAAHL